MGGLAHSQSKCPGKANMADATIYDVAQKAGVSISTVSRVLNNNQQVMEETRQKVLAAITDLGYSPNFIARSLVANNAKLIEVCFSWSSVKINMENAWYSGLLNGINEVLQEEKFGLLINTISGVFGPEEFQRRIAQNKVDGVLLVSPYLREEEIPSVKNFGVPVVLIGCRMAEGDLDYVDCDNQKGVQEVVDHLVKLRHKKIACITGEVEISRDAADRLAVFRQAMEKHGLAVPESYVVGGDFSEGSGGRAMDRLLALPDRPTAVFASNDWMAVGAWKSLEKAGLTPGKEMALVGFDDIPCAGRSPYFLTTVRQDYSAIGVRAARLLIEKIGVQNWNARHILLPTQLVVRRSCGSGGK